MLGKNWKLVALLPAFAAGCTSSSNDSSDQGKDIKITFGEASSLSLTGPHSWDNPLTLFSAKAALYCHDGEEYVNKGEKFVNFAEGEEGIVTFFNVSETDQNCQIRLVHFTFINPSADEEASETVYKYIARNIDADASTGNRLKYDLVSDELALATTDESINVMVRDQLPANLSTDDLGASFYYTQVLKDETDDGAVAMDSRADEINIDGELAPQLEVTGAMLTVAEEVSISLDPDDVKIRIDIRCKDWSIDNLTCAGVHLAEMVMYRYRVRSGTPGDFETEETGPLAALPVIALSPAGTATLEFTLGDWYGEPIEAHEFVQKLIGGEISLKFVVKRPHSPSRFRAIISFN